MRENTGKDSRTILAIGIFKLLKGVLLFATGVGALSLLHKDMAETVGKWVAALRVDPDNAMIHGIIGKLAAVTPKQLEKIGVGTFIYSGLLLTEGIGLLLRKHWAEYFTVITTAALIPVELYEMSKRVTAVKIWVLILNLAIVAYLAWRLRREASTKTGREAACTPVRDVAS